MADDSQQVRRAFGVARMSVHTALLEPARASIQATIDALNDASDGNLVVSVDDVELRLNITVSWTDDPTLDPGVDDAVTAPVDGDDGARPAADAR